MLLEENMNLLDLSLMLEGDLEDFYENVVVKYNFTNATQNITNITINPIYNTDENIVNSFLLKKIKIVTGNKNIFTDLNLPSFDSGYDEGF